MPPVPGGVLLAAVRIHVGIPPESFLPAVASSAAAQFSGYRGKNEVLLVCFPKIFFPLT